MYKDNFYYILKDRLEYAQDYLIDTSSYIQSVKFQDNVEREFFKDKILINEFISKSNINNPGTPKPKKRIYTAIRNCRVIYIRDSVGARLQQISICQILPKIPLSQSSSSALLWLVAPALPLWSGLPI